MKEEYIVISKTAIQKRIEELEKEVAFYNKVGALHLNPNKVKAETELSLLKQILFQSTPLIPVVEKAFDAGSSIESWSDFGVRMTYENSKDYITNLKIDI